MLNWRHWDSHKQRLVTGLALVVPLILILSAGPYWSWLLLLGVAVIAGLWELQSLLFAIPLPTKWLAFYITVGLMYPLGTMLGDVIGLHAVVVTGLLASLLVVLFSSPGKLSEILRISMFNFGWLYIPYLLSYVLLIGRLNSGRSWIFFIFAVIIAGDSGAFYTGRRFGRHKLYETVSPKKTLEGSIGGLLGSILAGTLFGFVFLRATSPWRIVLLSVILAIVGQLGDLVESMIKRMSGKKDSSQLLPGHGGLLDRLDSLLFAFPATWFFVTWMNR